MNERPAPADDDARRWACATLGVAEDAPLDTIRAAFLKQIGEADFYPSAESVVAWQSLSGHVAANPRARRILFQQVNQDLRKQVEQFAAAFFSINVAERVRQWFDLNSRCQSSAALSARLEGLSAGLHVDRDTVLASLPSAEGAADDAGPSEQEVATKIFELFVLRPVDRAERQQELLEAWQADLSSWQAAARKFKKQLPKIAELDAEFVDTILDTPRPAPRSKTTSTVYPPTQRQPATAKASRSWPISIVVFLALMGTSAISRCVRDDINLSKFKTPQQQTFQQPLQQPTIPGPVLPRLSPTNPPQPGPVVAPAYKKIKRRSANDAIERARERSREFRKDPFGRTRIAVDPFSPSQKNAPAESPPPSNVPRSNHAERDPPDD